MDGSPSRFESGDYVGNELILAPRDFVAQPQLALLHPRELKLIRNACVAKRDDRGVEIAMLEPKQFQTLGDFFGVHSPLLPRSAAVCNGPSASWTGWPNRDDIEPDS